VHTHHRDVHAYTCTPHTEMLCMHKYAHAKTHVCIYAHVYTSTETHMHTHPYEHHRHVCTRMHTSQACAHACTVHTTPRDTCVFTHVHQGRAHTCAQAHYTQTNVHTHEPGQHTTHIDMHIHECTSPSNAGSSPPSIGRCGMRCSPCHSTASEASFAGGRGQVAALVFASR
jgi:hypothetical protein